MIIPLVILSLFAVGIGFILSNATPFSIGKLLENLPGYGVLENHEHDLLTMTIATSAGVAGLVLSFVFYGTFGGPYAACLCPGFSPHPKWFSSVLCPSDDFGGNCIPDSPSKIDVV